MLGQTDLYVNPSEDLDLGPEAIELSLGELDPARVIAVVHVILDG